MRHFLASLLIASGAATTALAQEEEERVQPSPPPEVEAAEALVLQPTTGVVTADNVLSLTVPSETLMALKEASSEQAYLIVSACIDNIPVNFEFNRENLPESVGQASSLPLSVSLAAPQLALVGNSEGNELKQVEVKTRIYDAKQAPFDCGEGQTCIWKGEPQACGSIVVKTPPPPMWHTSVDTTFRPARYAGLHPLAASACCDDWIFSRSGGARVWGVTVGAPTFFQQQQGPIDPGCPGGIH